MIDRSKLPPGPTTEKACFRSERGLVFGTMHTISQEQYCLPKPRTVGWANGKFKGPLERSDLPKDFLTNVWEGPKTGGKPVEWLLNIGVETDSGKDKPLDEQGQEVVNVAEFAYYYFEMEHGLFFPHPHSGELPEEALCLLSGYLQTGMMINFANYREYLFSTRLSYLPFLITRRHFRFFVYNPTYQQVMAGIETFKRVLATIEPLKPNLPQAATLTYATIRFDEMLHIDADPWTRIKQTLDEVLLPHRAELGFVYGGIRGFQHARLFEYGMYDLKEERR